MIAAANLELPTLQPWDSANFDKGLPVCGGLMLDFTAALDSAAKMPSDADACGGWGLKPEHRQKPVADGESGAGSAASAEPLPAGVFFLQVVPTQVSLVQDRVLPSDAGTPSEGRLFNSSISSDVTSPALHIFSSGAEDFAAVLPVRAGPLGGNDVQTIAVTPNVSRDASTPVAKAGVQDLQGAFPQGEHKVAIPSWQKTVVGTSSLPTFALGIHPVFVRSEAVSPSDISGRKLSAADAPESASGLSERGGGDVGVGQQVTPQSLELPGLPAVDAAPAESGKALALGADVVAAPKSGEASMAVNTATSIGSQTDGQLVATPQMIYSELPADPLTGVAHFGARTVVTRAAVPDALYAGAGKTSMTKEIGSLKLHEKAGGFRPDVQASEAAPTAGTSSDGSDGSKEKTIASVQETSAAQDSSIGKITLDHVAGADLNTVVPVHPALAEKPSAPTVAALPQVMSPPPATHAALPGISSAKLVQAMGQTEMRVGMRSVEFGSISIRTSATPDLISAHISVDHSDLANALSNHIPEMQTKLGSGHAMHVEIGFLGQDTVSDGMSDQTPADSQGHRRQQSSEPSIGYSSSINQRLSASVVAAQSHVDGRATDRLDIRI